MSTTRGYGKKSQDWSYLTPKRAIAIQTGNVTDPSTLGSEFIINTTLTRKGDPIDRARQQTLVIYAIPKAGVTIAEDAVLNVWIRADWDETACQEPGGNPSSSSSSAVCPPIGAVDELDAPDRWALIEAAVHSNALATATGSKCFSFPWLPAGIYKAAMGSGISGGSTQVIIAEQHTE